MAGRRKFDLLQPRRCVRGSACRCPAFAAGRILVIALPALGSLYPFWKRLRRRLPPEARGGPGMSFLDLFAWIVLILLAAIIVAVFVALGMLPGYIARKRNHPWAEAVAVGGWVTLIFGFVFWPLVLIWAYVDVPAKKASSP